MIQQEKLKLNVSLVRAIYIYFQRQVLPVIEDYMFLRMELVQVKLLFQLILIIMLLLMAMPRQRVN